MCKVICKPLDLLVCKPVESTKFAMSLPAGYGPDNIIAINFYFSYVYRMFVFCNLLHV